jgi:curved DNA-binding protein CbpA
LERDWYAVLGVPRGAPAAEIKLAYRELALIHHPDRHPGSDAAAKKFMLVKEAYEILSDPHERLLHDQELRLQEGKAWSPPPLRAAAPSGAAEEGPRKPRRRGLTDGQILSRALIVIGALLAGRGLLGAYLAPQSGLLDRWLSLRGGQTEAFMLLCGGIALAIFGLAGH